MDKKVLILDDNKDFLQELKETLKLCGYDMIAVADPYAVLDIVSREQVAVVLLDLKMPNKTGFDVAFELSSSPRSRDIPVIAMTAFYKEEYEPVFARCGIKKCLKKPFRPLDVINAIEDVRMRAAEAEKY
jgi:CheY-like chemotaxis protein